MQTITYCCSPPALSTSSSGYALFRSFASHTKHSSQPFQKWLVPRSGFRKGLFQTLQIIPLSFVVPGLCKAEEVHPKGVLRPSLPKALQTQTLPYLGQPVSTIYRFPVLMELTLLEYQGPADLFRSRILVQRLQHLITLLKAPRSKASCRSMV